MSERLINHWGKDTIEAFGDTPQIQRGIQAESLYHAYAQTHFDVATLNVEDRQLQVAGADIQIKNHDWPSHKNVDVKGNLHSDGTFYVENYPSGWLRNPKKEIDLIVHVNPISGMAIEYALDDMRAYAKNREPVLIKYNVNTLREERLPTLRKYNVKENLGNVS